MRLYFTIILSLCSIQIFGQQRGGNFKRPAASTIKGKITGIIVDAKDDKPLSFVTIVVRNPVTQKDVDGTISEDNGSFKLSNIPIGNYNVLISFVGYETITKKITSTPKKPDVNLGKVKLAATFQQLDEVVVQGEKELVESRIDKIVYNAERDVANAGGDASDVLRRAPLLSVDLEGNVSLRGSSNIQILLNGKPSTLFAGSPADALKVIPADQIKSVEVITTPSAKYDGEGTAGIINIITKKKKVEGFVGNVNMSVGTRQNNAVLGLNAGKGRFGFNANGSTYYSWPRDGSSSFYREDNVGETLRTLNEDGSTEGSRIGFFATAGAFYDFNAYHNVTSSFRLRGFGSDREGIYLTNYDDPSIDLSQRYQRSSISDRLVSGYEWSIDYIIKFPEHKEKELAFSYKLDGNVSNQDFVIEQEDLVGNDADLFRDERNENDGTNRENTIQVDYAHPAGEKIKIETGAKAVLRSVKSDYSYEFFDLSRDAYIIDASRTDLFDYEQDVMSGYFSSNIKFSDKYGLIAGVRFEHTHISGAFENFEAPFENDYDNWLPNIIFSRKFGKMTTAKLSYNRRIQRPSLRFINPYAQIDNNRNISVGNPELEPELTDQIELSYNTFIKKMLLNISGYYKRTTDNIESFLQVDDEGISTVTFQNVGENNSFGLNAFTSVTMFKIWTLRGGINLFTYNASGIVDGESLTNEAVLFNGNINSNIKLKKDWIIDMFGFYRSRRQTLQGFNPSFSIFSMGIRKTIWEKRGSIGLRIVEPFFENKKFGSELRGDNYYQTSENVIAFRSFGINFNYKFGKLDFKQQQRRSKIKNDDMGGRDDNQQF